MTVFKLPVNTVHNEKITPLHEANMAKDSTRLHVCVFVCLCIHCTLYIDYTDYTCTYTLHTCQVSSLVDELGSLEDILFAGHTGVVVKLTEAAVSCPEKQPTIVKSLLRAFHTEHDPEHCALVFLSLMTHEMVFGSDDKAKVYLYTDLHNYSFAIICRA